LIWFEGDIVELSEYIHVAIKNIHKRIDRGKHKHTNINKSILKRIDMYCKNGDINSLDFLNFLCRHKDDLKNKIECSDIDNDLEYNVESEQHDYCHRSTWITDIINNFYYSYYVLKEKNEITYSMLIYEAISIARIKKDDDGLYFLHQFEKLIRSKKMFEELIKGIGDNNG
jgi:hypothetical protein